ncbi:YicC family protein [Heyndrickxia sporothermodurans]|nr:YicC/YloC family endoribonuclease [Heyndrickxia sporothermodurans]PTY79614.1 YicC family protein [Heyndrickxia sporothermodurans]PTY79937.1 YicC family protein [Heyndrickxia sporothermodurans]PTY84759.1 YicC family protein [Heyndrickxia sporothermodurans]PTY86217.1 YicC family protein [Heyndrickxia sporothermodurans]
MTGYGSSKKDSTRFGVFVEIKSVNHRFSEINIRMPRQLMKIDDKIKKVINKFINRGRVEVFVTLDGDGLTHKSLHIDWNLLDDYYQFINTLKQKYNFPDDIQLRDILMNEDFLEIVEKEDENEEIYQLVLEAVEEAVQNLKAMREVEGKELFQDLSDQIKHFSQRILYIKELAPLVVEQYQTKLQKRMNDLSDGIIDEARLMTEIGIFAEKADINEEITRLESHVAQFKDTILLQEPIGRKLDFMIQEMNREVNTIGSKANHSKISSYVVDMKTILEKIREQVQNIE